MNDHSKTHTSRPPVTGVFRNRQDAERALETMNRRGYAPNDATFVMSEDTRKKHWPVDETKPGNKSDNRALEGTGVGGSIGAAVGATAGAVLALGTVLSIPPLGLVVAGPLAAGLAGAGAGAVSGGVIGALVGAGIPEDKAKLYDQEVKRGNIVIGVTPRNDEDASYFEREWIQFRPGSAV